MATPLPHLSYRTLDDTLTRRNNRATTIAPNTVARRHLCESTIIVTLYDHEIARLYEDGNVWVSDAGYSTATTLRRLRALVPQGYSVFSHRGQTYITHRDYAAMGEISVSALGGYFCGGEECAG